MDQMVTSRTTTLGTPRATTPSDIELLSPGIYDNYFLSRSTKSVTPDSMNPNIKIVTEIIKYPKIIKILK